jgi:hypothetical protein
LKTKVLVRVNPDGTGNIVVSQLLSDQAISMMAAQFGNMSADFGGAMPGIDTTNAIDRLHYNERVLRKLGRIYGSGVTYVKGKEVRQAGARGSIAVYAFEDVNDIQIELMRLMMAQSVTMSMAFMQDDISGELDEMLEGSMMEMFGGGVANAIEFRLAHSNGVATLHVLTPQPAETATTLTATEGTNTVAKAAGAATRETMAAAYMAESFEGGPEAAAFAEMQAEGVDMDGDMGADMAEQMLRGLRITVEVETAGRRLSGAPSHSHADKPERFTVLDADFDTMASAPGFDAIMNLEDMDTPGDMPSLFTDIKEAPGLLREKAGDLVIQFE